MTTPAAASPSPRSSSAVLALLAAFVLGMIAGGAVLHIARAALWPLPPGPHPPPPPPIRRLQHDLGLDGEQVEKLERIIDESRERMHGEMEATRQRIREILTPQQRVRFDAMKPPPPPGFPPPRGGPEGPPPGPEGPPPGPNGPPPGDEPR